MAVSVLKEIPTLKIVGKKRRFVAANDRVMGHHGRKEVKFGKMLSFTEVTMPSVAVRRTIEKENEVHFGAENNIRNAKGGKIPVRKKCGSQKHASRQRL